MKYLRVYEQAFLKPVAIMPMVHVAIRTTILKHITGEVDSKPLARVSGDDSAPRRISGPPRYDEKGDRMSNYVPGGKYFIQQGAIAVLPVEGIIGQHISDLEIDCGACSVEYTRQALESAVADNEIQTIVLAFNSPGGSIGGVPELADYIASIEKHTVAFTDSLMASAAYWLGACCDEVWCTLSADVGSIGVYCALLDQSVWMQMTGLKMELFKAGEHKALGLPGNPLTDKDRALLQSGVDKAYDWFTKSVTAKRSAVQSESMQGQCFDGADAVANGLVDGTVSDLNSLIAELQKLTMEK